MLVYAIRLLAEGGLYSNRTLVVGNVELRHAMSDLLSEVRVLGLSAASLNLAFSDLNMRIATLIDGSSATEIEQESETRFREAIDLLVAERPNSLKLGLLPVGLYRRVD